MKKSVTQIIPRWYNISIKLVFLNQEVLAMFTIKNSKFTRPGLWVFPVLVLIGLLVLGCSSGGELSEGDQAPDFSLPVASGGELSLADATADGPALLYFHMSLG